MKIKYSNHTFGEEVTIQLTDKKVTIKADEVIEVSDDEAKGLVVLDAFTVVKDAKPSSKEVKGE